MNTRRTIMISTPMSFFDGCKSSRFLTVGRLLERADDDFRHDEAHEVEDSPHPIQRAPGLLELLGEPLQRFWKRHYALFFCVHRLT